MIIVALSFLSLLLGGASLWVAFQLVRSSSFTLVSLEAPPRALPAFPSVRGFGVLYAVLAFTPFLAASDFEVPYLFFLLLRLWVVVFAGHVIVRATRTTDWRKRYVLPFTLLALVFLFAWDLSVEAWGVLDWFAAGLVGFGAMHLHAAPARSRALEEDAKRWSAATAAALRPSTITQTARAVTVPVDEELARMFPGGVGSPEYLQAMRASAAAQAGRTLAEQIVELTSHRVTIEAARGCAIHCVNQALLERRVEGLSADAFYQGALTTFNRLWTARGASPDFAEYLERTFRGDPSTWPSL